MLKKEVIDFHDKITNGFPFMSQEMFVKQKVAIYEMTMKAVIWGRELE